MGNQRVTYCDFYTCNKLFSNKRSDSLSTSLRHNFEPTEYNCTLINCCRGIYKRDLKYNTFDGITTIYPSDGSKLEPRKRLYQYIAFQRNEAMFDWMKEHNDECKKFF